MNSYDLAKVLASHALWLAGDLQGARANLRYADLSDANLARADLTDVILTNADLAGADLAGADLAGADLRGADLFLVDLRGANLVAADLCDANLCGANLCGVDLRGANLRGADLAGGDLTNAVLIRANLIDANLVGTTLPDYLVLPSTGPIVVYKKVVGAVLTLFVPRDAMRTSCLQSRKCRVSKAKVVASTGEGVEWRSMYEAGFYYRLGEWVKPDEYDDDIRHECTNGLHVFATRAEAAEY